MKSFVFLIAVFINTFLFLAAQERSTTGMKIIVVVDAKSNTIPSITPFDTFQKMMVFEVFDTYPACDFYMGSLKGNYRLIEANVIPTEHSIVTMYTERGVFRSGDFLEAKNLVVGDDFSLGKFMSEVTSNEKGVLRLIIK